MCISGCVCTLYGSVCIREYVSVCTVYGSVCIREYASVCTVCVSICIREYVSVVFLAFCKVMEGMVS